MVIKRRKLLSFTDTKTEALKRQRMFKKRGATNVVIKKQYGAFAVLGTKKKK